MPALTEVAGTVINPNDHNNISRYFFLISILRYGHKIRTAENEIVV